VAAALMPIAGAYGRGLLAVIGPLVALAAVIMLPADAHASIQVLGQELVLLDVTRMGRLFAFAFTAYGALSALYAWTQRGPGGRFWSMVLVIGGTGVTMVGDWLSLMLFWEMLAIGSAFLIWRGRDPQSQAAGFRYIMFHVAGGVSLLGGVLWQIQSGSPLIEPLELSDGLGPWLILIGMAVNAAVVPLHAWLPDAYPRATIFGTVFLAAFTTKSAVYTLARSFPGEQVLMWAGAAMAVYGVYYALLENNIRRLLGYHIVSQVGYMVCGVGIGTALAVDGSSAHAFCHIFYKGLLLMSAGAVIHATGKEKLSELGQLAGPMKWTFVFMMIGAFSIAGVPLFNGFVSKSLVTAAAGESKQGTVYLLLYIASMGTFLSIALKLAWFTFLGVDHGARVERPVPRGMIASMAIVAAICLFTGIPGGHQILYDHLPTPIDSSAAAAHAHEPAGQAEAGQAEAGYAEAGQAEAGDDTPDAQTDHGHAASAATAASAGLSYHPYSAYHLFDALQLLLGTALGFWLLRSRLVGKPAISLDVDRLYRRPTFALTDSLGAALQAVGRRVEAVTNAAISAVWTGMSTYRDARQHIALAHQIAVILFVVAALGYFVLYIMN
jgi:multicomponent Na+:H+ antiporter subunit D